VDENAPSPPRGPATPTAADRTPAALSLDDTADLIAPQHSPSHIVIAKRPATNRKPIKFRQVGLSFKQDSNSREEIGLLHSAAQAAGHQVCDSVDSIFHRFTVLNCCVQISHTTAPHQSETPGTLDVVLGSDSAGVMHRAGHTPRSDHNLYDMRQRLVSLYQQQRQQQQQQQQQQTPTQPAQASRVPDTDAKQSLPKLALPPLPVSLNLTLSASEPEGPVSTLNNRRRMSRLFPPMKIKSNSITAPISQQINQTAATATNNLADYTPALQGDKVKGMLLSAEKQKQLQPELQSLDDLDMQVCRTIILCKFEYVDFIHSHRRADREFDRSATQNEVQRARGRRDQALVVRTLSVDWFMHHHIDLCFFHAPFLFQVHLSSHWCRSAHLHFAR
jgi:hypothetical protein